MTLNHLFFMLLFEALEPAGVSYVAQDSMYKGKYEDTVKDCTKALELNSYYVQALLRRGEADEKLEHFEEAIADLKKVVELNPSDVQARRTIQCLEPLITEKLEKMKR